MATTSSALDAVRDELWRQSEFSFIPDRDLTPLPGIAMTTVGQRVVFAGFPSDYSVAFLLALLGLDGIQVAAVLTSPGAHEAILGENALSRICDHVGIPLLRAWRVNDEHTLLDLIALRPAAVVMASFDQIIRTRALEIPRHGWMNIHPSALPARRGPEPVYWTIAEGDRFGGITLHRAAPKVDAGPVLAQRTDEVREDDTSGTLTKRLTQLGVDALEGAVADLIRGVEGTPIDVGSGTYAPSVGHRHLDDASTAVAALRMIRAGVPNMPAWTAIDGHPAYVRRAHAGIPSDGQHGLQFTDGQITLDEVGDQCGCHHNLISCPHLQE